MAANMIYLAVVGMSNGGNCCAPKLTDTHRRWRGGKMLPATTFRSSRSSRYSTSFSCLCLPLDEECCIRRLPTDRGLASRGFAKFLLNAFVEFLRNGNLPRQSTWASYPCGQYQQ